MDTGYPRLIFCLIGLFLAATPLASAAGRGTMLVDFESGTVDLLSYEDEDFDPNAWELQGDNTYNGSDYALRLWGNTWKEFALDPYQLDAESILQAAIYSAEEGELQAIGFGDGSENMLFYVVSGEQLVLDDRWNVVYQGAYPQQQWRGYLLGVGQDWFDTWGYLPSITRIVFVNDHDGSSHGETIFDEIYDVTSELPVAPLVEIQQFSGRAEKLADQKSERGEDLYRIEVQFQSVVYDPDSEVHAYFWDFGDGSVGEDPNPTHTFTAIADYTFTVSLDVTDETGLFGRETVQVTVEPSGGEDGLISVNFAGDVFLGRNYDEPGGLIDTYGVEYLFEPTLPILGQAADITVINAECAYTDQGEPHPTKSVVFRTRPENVAGLTYAGVEVAALGNNHIIDYGIEGLVQTQEVFDAAGIVHGGSGVNAYFAEQPCYYTRDGVRLALISMCNRTGREYNYQPFLDAGYDKPGMAYWLQPNLERALAQADSLADIVVAFPHSGIEYEIAPEQESMARTRQELLEMYPPGSPEWLPPHDTEEILEIDVELCPPYVAEADAPDFRFRVWPGMTDRQLRWHAVDLGADAVINHHPHVLQGFEVYNGVLIAHSLGNFMMDLYYPETMPTIALKALFDKDGLHRWTFKPAFIDDWVTRPSHGRLGREILDRMADYSRQLGATVGVDSQFMMGLIFIDPAEATQVVSQSEGTVGFYDDNGYAVSEPILLAGEGSLSKILEMNGIDPQDCEVCWGRELLWFGRFEQDAEGHHMWNLNSSGEEIVDTEFFEGEHSLRLHREHNAGENVVTLVKKHWPANADGRYNISGWMKTENAHLADFRVRFYSGRYSWNPIGEGVMGDAVDGTTDWTYFTQDCVAPEETHYFNVRCNLDPPQDGDGYAWFDDLRVVEWLGWQALALPMDVPFPNNYRFVQVRVPGAAEQVTMVYEETKLTDGGFSSVPEDEPAAPVGVLLRGAAPNPVRTHTTLSYRLSGRAQVSLNIYDLSGRLVETLVDQAWQRPGWHRVQWQASDISAGIYFSTLRVGEEVHSKKLVVVQ